MYSSYYPDFMSPSSSSGLRCWIKTTAPPEPASYIIPSSPRLLFGFFPKDISSPTLCRSSPSGCTGTANPAVPSTSGHWREPTIIQPESWTTVTVIALFCRQYDIIKDNDSNGTKEKAKRPLVQASTSYYNASAGSSPIYHNGAVHSSRVRRSLKILFFWVFYKIHDQDSVSAAEVPE
ncbi:hypothetical protein XENOCAPTIV_025554 [Xenoophorus captivus]|uniref:Uncharacterized protein n=1 Tax=Xenoophorus captivus TaxID=1517983 RepID=A0ABV0QKS9_9TELE